jgi:5-methylcytosine-specific restriction endonuclease McrA
MREAILSEQRRRVRERSGNVCEQCGSNSQLGIHHIKYSFQSEDFDENDLIMLCWTCHQARHMDDLNQYHELEDDAIYRNHMIERIMAD